MYVVLKIITVYLHANQIVALQIATEQTTIIHNVMSQELIAAYCTTSINLFTWFMIWFDSISLNLGTASTTASAL